MAWLGNWIKNIIGSWFGSSAPEPEPEPEQATGTGSYFKDSGDAGTPVKKRYSYRTAKKLRKVRHEPLPPVLPIVEPEAEQSQVDALRAEMDDLQDDAAPLGDADMLCILLGINVKLEGFNEKLTDDELMELFLILSD